uniref:Uncharacterized protein n=1 Tax=Phaeomonas parva TaxID=124430 RepID=A0A7S1TRN8_9STRA|mmetsp:Transcript_12924/g.38615  ORF Transcript_12924/g.38615 Transcript_12924/m.38615 type:complete len:143 (+) Transcript_12924:259-687(+)
MDLSEDNIYLACDTETLRGYLRNALEAMAALRPGWTDFAEFNTADSNSPLHVDFGNDGEAPAAWPPLGYESTLPMTASPITYDLDPTDSPSEGRGRPLTAASGDRRGLKRPVSREQRREGYGRPRTATPGDRKRGAAERQKQ